MECKSQKARRGEFAVLKVCRPLFFPAKSKNWRSLGQRLNDANSFASWNETAKSLMPTAVVGDAKIK